MGGSAVIQPTPRCGHYSRLSAVICYVIIVKELRASDGQTNGWTLNCNDNEEESLIPFLCLLDGEYCMRAHWYWLQLLCRFFSRC